jgi:hypothetical protein
MLLPEDVLPHLTGEQITEASLSRLFKHMTGSEGFVILSADRGVPAGGDVAAQTKVNMANRDKLRGMILQMGYGYHQTEGRFIENKGKPDQREVAERSFFVPHVTKADAIKFAELAYRHFKRQSIIYGVGVVDPRGEKNDNPDTGVYFIDGQTGEVSRAFSNLTLASIKDAYADAFPRRQQKGPLRKDHTQRTATDRKFAFDTLRWIPNGMAGTLAWACKLAALAGFPHAPYTGAPWRE